MEAVYLDLVYCARGVDGRENGNEMDHPHVLEDYFDLEVATRT